MIGNSRGARVIAIPTLIYSTHITSWHCLLLTLYM